jgi:magnesium transporter
MEDYLNMHAADLADHLQRLPAEEAREILQRLPRAKAAAVAAELEPDKAEELLPGLSVRQLSEMLQQLPHNEAADVAADLPLEQRGQALAQLPAADSAQVKALLRYPEDTAGGIMSDQFIALREEQTVQECQEMLRAREEQDVGDVTYLCVTDANQKLVGVVSLRDLVFRKPDRKIGEFMNRDVKFLWADADQEEIARRFEHYHYMGLPALERDRRLVGVVRASDVIEVMRKEATEDMQLMVGLPGEERALTPWRKSVGRRLPWLCVNLATAFLAAAVVNLFESTIAR